GVHGLLGLGSLCAHFCPWPQLIVPREWALRQPRVCDHRGWRAVVQDCAGARAASGASAAATLAPGANDQPWCRECGCLAIPSPTTIARSSWYLKTFTSLSAPG